MRNAMVGSMHILTASKVYGRVRREWNDNCSLVSNRSKIRAVTHLNLKARPVSTPAKQRPKRRRHVSRAAGVLFTGRRLSCSTRSLLKCKGLMGSVSVAFWDAWFSNASVNACFRSSQEGNATYAID